MELCAQRCHKRSNMNGFALISRTAAQVNQFGACQRSTLAQMVLVHFASQSTARQLMRISLTGWEIGCASRFVHIRPAREDEPGAGQVPRVVARGHGAPRLAGAAKPERGAA